MVNMETNSDERKIIDRVLHRDMVFRYQLLGRLQTDCEYYLLRQSEYQTLVGRQCKSAN